MKLNQRLYIPNSDRYGAFSLVENNDLKSIGTVSVIQSSESIGIPR